MRITISDHTEEFERLLTLCSLTILHHIAYYKNPARDIKSYSSHQIVYQNRQIKTRSSTRKRLKKLIRLTLTTPKYDEYRLNLTVVVHHLSANLSVSLLLTSPQSIHPEKTKKTRYLTEMYIHILYIWHSSLVPISDGSMKRQIQQRALKIIRSDKPYTETLAELCLSPITITINCKQRKLLTKNV